MTNLNSESKRAYIRYFPVLYSIPLHVNHNMLALAGLDLFHVVSGCSTHNWINNLAEMETASKRHKVGKTCLKACIRIPDRIVVKIIPFKEWSTRLE